MKAQREHSDLTEAIDWINTKTSDLMFATDERTLIAVACFDVALEHQAAVACLHVANLPGSMLALLRVLSESVVRGLWLFLCATEEELTKFKRGKIDKTFKQLISEFESRDGVASSVLSTFRANSWQALNDFTHTGFNQVIRRHAQGRVEASYPDHELAQALDVALVLGFVGAAQLVAMSNRGDLVADFTAKMREFSARRPPMQKEKK